MSKSNLFSSPALVEENQVQPQFNLFVQSNPVHTFFGVKPLDSNESNNLEKILVDGFQPGAVSEEEIIKNTEQLKTITSEIKAINKQAVLLIGERVYQVREMLKSYIDGTFVKWIDMTFESRKTAYNMLSYYELYQSLPHYAKEIFKKIPQKAAYILASKNGDIEKKAKIISNYQNLKANDMIILIQEEFPTSRVNRLTMSYNTKLINSIYDCIRKINERKEELSREQKQELAVLKDLIDKIIA